MARGNVHGSKAQRYQGSRQDQQAKYGGARRESCGNARSAVSAQRDQFNGLGQQNTSGGLSAGGVAFAPA